jgi:hypothetical protein
MPSGNCSLCSSPPPSRAAAHPGMTVASWSTPWPTGCGPAVPGGCSLMICRPGRPSTPTSAAGGGKGCGSRSTIGCMSRNAPGKAGRPPRARRFWTARASRPPNGGATRLRRRQAAQRPQAPPAGRHPRPDLQSAPERGRCGRPRRRHGAAQAVGPPPVSRLRYGWVDGGYRGPFLDWTRQRRGIAFQVVQGHDGGRQRRWLPAGATPPIVSPFAVVPRRWVVDGPLPGWVVTDGSARTTTTSPPPPRRSSTWP